MLGGQVQQQGPQRMYPGGGGNTGYGYGSPMQPMGGYYGGQNPMQPVYSPNPPYGQAAYTNINLSPRHTLAEIMRGFRPVQRQATSALNNTLAASGIVGGGAQGAQQTLQGQLAASIAPTLAQAIQGSQGMELGQAQGNAGAANQMTNTNLADWMQTNMFNSSAANQARQALAQMLMQGWQTQMGGLSSILGGGLAGSSALAGSEANNFPVYPPTLWSLFGI